MKKNSVNFKPRIFITLLVVLAIAQGCDRDNEVEFVGNASIQGKLQYQDAVSGAVKDVPAGAAITLYFNGSTIPSHTVQTTESGYWHFAPQGIGTYKIVIRRQDTLVQFTSALVQKEDLDSTRAAENITVTYFDSATVEVKRDEKELKDFLLRTPVIGLRITAKDEFGHPIKGVSMCLYNNEAFYKGNFPNCGGSLKYIMTDEAGKALFLGLALNTTYFVNARGKVGAATISNHYAKEAQEFRLGSEEGIQDRNVILK